MATSSAPRVAILYQAVEPPVVNGVKKPMKPGGYKDSCADIAYRLSTSSSVSVVTPVPSPDVNKDDDYAWCFPDTEAGILKAIEKGATHLWANTILFASHPLQTSVAIASHAQNIKVVGQPPLQVEQFDDKEVVNDMLRAAGTFTMPQGWTLTCPYSASRAKEPANTEILQEYITSLSLPYPVVGKPIRGRGSHGVKVCHSLEELVGHARGLFDESPRIMVEEYLAGEEGTVSVMPRSSSSSSSPTAEKSASYYALPLVQRSNHHAGIAPYNGLVPVSVNSRAITAAESDKDEAYALVQRECEGAAELLRPTGLIRIDVRRRLAGPRSGEKDVAKFCLFDVNVKPNLTGPGRPGRNDQACLSLLAAQELGWDYSKMLHEMLKTATPLDELKKRTPTSITAQA